MYLLAKFSKCTYIKVYLFHNTSKRYTPFLNVSQGTYRFTPLFSTFFGRLPKSQEYAPPQNSPRLTQNRCTPSYFQKVATMATAEFSLRGFLWESFLSGGFLRRGGGKRRSGEITRRKAPVTCLTGPRSDGHFCKGK